MGALQSRVGLVLLFGALLACKGSKSKEDEGPPTVKAPPAPAAAEPSAAPWKPGPDIAAIESIIAGTEKPTSVDDNGERLNISHYDVPGWSLAMRAVRKDDPKAWKLQLEGDRCDPNSLGPKVTLKGRDSATWYAVAGGPLAGSVVKAFEDQRPCIFHLATPEYAAAEGWKQPPAL